jgi:hypothetical protein
MLHDAVTGHTYTAGMTEHSGKTAPLRYVMVLKKCFRTQKKEATNNLTSGARVRFSRRTLSHIVNLCYESVSKSFRTGCLERELQMVQLSTTRCSCIAILWVSLMSFAAITLCVASQRVFIVVVVYFVTT